MQEITKAQEEVLKALWKIQQGAVSDVLDALHDPKPAYTTVATVIKVLEGKGYVQHVTYGKTNVYSPVISQNTYAQHVARETYKNLFNGSLQRMFSCFVKDENISLSELDELKKMIENKIENSK